MSCDQGLDDIIGHMTSSPVVFHHTVPKRWRTGKHVSGRVADYAGAPGLIGCVFNAHDGGEEEFRDLQQSQQHFVTKHYGLYALSFCIRGSAHFTANGRRHSVSPGTVFQYNDVAHRQESPLEPGPDYLDCSLFMRGRFLRTMEQLGVWDHDVACEPSGGGADLVATYVDMFNSLVDERLPADAVLRLAIALIERVYARIRDTRPTDDLVTRACRLLAAHPEPGFSMPEAARDLGVDYRTLRRRFRDQMDMSPQDFQLQQRMRIAGMMLHSESVKTVAEHLGYSDPYLFSRQFKRVHGVPPSRFHGGK